MAARSDLPDVNDATPLAEAKLAAPRPRAGIVPRPRLSVALDAGKGTPVTLVAAPAGYGKTTAIVLGFFAVDTLRNDPETFGAI
jgi:ATP/maltotriose-dependent transcriptional regulator MalT